MNNIDITTITHENVQQIFVSYKQILLKNKELHINFGQTQKFDSSIFALILGLRRIANKYKYSFSIELSQSMKTLADVYEIYDIL